jgi:hypothetical protein
MRRVAPRAGRSLAVMLTICGLTLSSLPIANAAFGPSVVRLSDDTCSNCHNF